jgi:hypothetical protein
MVDFLRSPVRKARQLCGCQPVALEISSTVAPFLRERMRVTMAALVVAFASAFISGLREAAQTICAATDPSRRRACSLRRHHLGDEQPMLCSQR